jgi:hypothetical protein
MYTAALLQLYCCFTAALLLNSSSYHTGACLHWTQTQAPALLLLLLQHYSCFTPALLYCCFTAALLLLYCCFYSCFTPASLLLCFTAALLLFYCCFTADLLLLQKKNMLYCLHICSCHTHGDSTPHSLSYMYIFLKTHQKKKH